MHVMRSVRLRTAWTMLAVVLLCGAWALRGSAAEPAPQPIHGVWVANVGSDVLTSAAASRKFVDLCARCGINTLFVVVWNRGQTVYPSDVMQREFGIRCDPRYADRDALQDIIDAAHAKGIRVFAWFEFGFSSSYQEPDGGHILRARPQWAARDVDGRIVSKDDFQWMNAFDPEVQDFLIALMSEVVAKYDVDGVQGDDRLPAVPSTAGYDTKTVEAYRSEHSGNPPPADHFQEDWIDWRAERLNQFLERLRRELKSVDPDLLIAAAPGPYPWCKREYLQDWPTWVAKGWVDIVSPELYRDNIEGYRAELAKVVDEQVTADKLARVFPGILVRTADGYRSQDELLEQTILENRRRGIAGEVIFYDAGLVAHEQLFQRLLGHKTDQ